MNLRTIQRVLIFVTITLVTLTAQSAPTTDDVLETGGQLGKLGIDVLQDFTFDGLDAEASGKARLEAFVKDKIKGDLKNKITGGDDLSEGMGQILNRIYERINTGKRTAGGFEGICQAAALNQARAIAFDAKNVRLLRGAANVWFDTITAIPGAPALAEKLVTDIGKAGYEKIRSKMEDLIKKHYTEGKNETFKYSRGTGSCSLSMIVIWNKKRGKYLFLIKGDCKCKEVGTGPNSGNRKIRMRGFEIIGGGNVTLRLSVKNPEKPELKLYVGPARYQLNADCRCEKTIEEPPPPPPEEKPVHLSLHEGIFFKDKLECQACADLYADLEGYAKKTREYAAKMNEIANRVNKEKFDTADRRKDIKEWNRLLGEFHKWNGKFDKLYPAYVNCEETECKLTGAISLPIRDSRYPFSTTCDKCTSIVTKLNEAVKKYNAHVQDMNGIAVLANKLEHGTKDGNKLYRDWQQKETARKLIVGEIEAGVKAKRSCEAEHCYGRKPYEKRKLTTACKACAVPQQRLNQAEKEYNEMVDKINAADQKYKEFLMAGGDPATKKGNELSHASIKLFDKFNKIADRMYKLERELRKCDPDRCGADVSDDTKIRIGEDVRTEPVDKKFALDAACTGGGCPAEPVIGTCTGDTCPETFNLFCTDSICPETFELDCDSSPCPDNVNIDCDALGCFAKNIQFAFNPIQEGGAGSDGTPQTGDDSVVDELSKPLRKISTNCAPCQSIVSEYNSKIDEIQRLTGELKAALEKKQSQENHIKNLEEYELALQYPQESGLETWSDGKKYMSYSAVGGHHGAAFHGPNALRAAAEHRDLIRTWIDKARTELRKILENIQTLTTQRDTAYQALTGLTIQLVRCERKCAIVRILNVISLGGNNPYDRRDPVSQESGANEPTILVINNIPISRLIIGGPELPVLGPNNGCANNHYHGNADDCNGNFVLDPLPGGCGHGIVGTETAIPISACPDI